MPSIQALIDKYGIKESGNTPLEDIPYGTLVSATVLKSEVAVTAAGVPYLRVGFGIADGKYKGRKVSGRSLDWGFWQPRRKTDAEGKPLSENGKPVFTKGTIGQLMYSYRAVTGEVLPVERELDASFANDIAEAIISKPVVIEVIYEKDRQDSTRRWARGRPIQLDDPNYAKKLAAVGLVAGSEVEDSDEPVDAAPVIPARRKR